MGKISNRELYTKDTNITGKEYWILSNEDKTTKTLALNEVASFLQGGGGIQNLDGTYTWVKYAIDDQGTDMTDTPTIETPYIGLAYNKISNIESTDPADYIWALIDGENYWIDENGVYHYTWIKYADTPTTGMSDSPFGKSYIGFAYDKTTSVESTDYADYQWTSIKSFTPTSDQDNKVRVIEIEESDLISVDAIGIAYWVNQNGIQVDEDEIVVFNVNLSGVTESPVLDLNKSLVLTSENVTQTTADLSWETNEDNAIEKYTLVYTNTDKKVTKTIVFQASTTNTVLTGLDDGDNYSVYLIAFDSSNNQKLSNVDSFATIESFADSTPNIKITGITDTTATLKCNVDASLNADSYEFYQDDVRIYAGPNDTYQQTSLDENTSYDFHTIAFSGSTPSNPSTPVSITTLLTVDAPLTKPILSFVYKGLLPDDVGGFVISTTVEIPELEWNRIEEGGDSKIYYRVLGATTWNETAYSVADNLGILKGLLPSTTYEIRVQLSDGNVLSPFSDTILVTTVSGYGPNILFEMERFGEIPAGLLDITNGEPNESIEVDMTLTFQGPVGIGYDVTLTTTIDGTPYAVSDNSVTPGTEAQRTITIPIQLDQLGKFLDAQVAVTGTIDVTTSTVYVIATYKVTKRSAGNLSTTSFSANFGTV